MNMKKIGIFLLVAAVALLSAPIIFVGMVGRFFRNVADSYLDALEATMNQSKKIFNKF